MRPSLSAPSTLAELAFRMNMNLLLHNVLGTSGALAEDSAVLSLKEAHVPDLVKMLFAYVLYEVRNVAPADLVHMPFVIVEEVGQWVWWT